jgi:hypothetical protein
MDEMPPNRWLCHTALTIDFQFHQRIKGLRILRGKRFCGLMPRQKPRFRIFLRDCHTGRTLRLELIERPFPSSRRYCVRVNGRNAAKIPEVSLTTAMDRLRRWLVKQA